MRTSTFCGYCRVTVVALALCALALPVVAQPFLSYDFEDGEFEDFFNPAGQTAVDVCGTVIPSGPAAVDMGELELTNDDAFGLSMVTLLPEVVEASFPASGDYDVRLKVNMVTSTQALIYVRARVRIDIPNNTLSSDLERGYAIVLRPTDSDPEFADGYLGLAEFNGCHELAEHPEWPNGTLGFARVDIGDLILQDEWYWVAISSRGNDDGGPVFLSVKAWADGTAEPDDPQLIVTDPDGLTHTAETRADAANVQLLLGASFDVPDPDGDFREPSAMTRFDDVTLSIPTGCETAPVDVTRTLWGEPVNVEGTDSAVYSGGESYDVTLALDNARAAGSCAAAGVVRVTEIVPSGWTVESTSPPATVDAETIAWEIDLGSFDGGGGGLPTLSYTVGASGAGRVSFSGTFAEPDSEFIFGIEGLSSATSDSSLNTISDFGSIQHWLTLGAFTRQVGGANPGEEEIVRDYLTDGDVTQVDVRPSAGDQIEPDYGGDAASLSLAADSSGHNQGGIPTWFAWRDLDDDDDRIDFEGVYGADIDEVMAHALTYINVEEEIVVHFGVSSDDAVHILLDGQTLHANAVARGALGLEYQDTPSSHPNLGNVVLEEGQHVMLVKVFEGGGEHNFRVGFLDENGNPIAGGPEGVTIALEPEPTVVRPIFKRGDTNSDGQLNIADYVYLLNRLFGGGPPVACLETADINGDTQINIADPVYGLNFQFGGGPPPPDPGPNMCGPDPDKPGSPGDQGCAVYDAVNC